MFAASANGARLSFTRNVGNIIMDTDGVETLALNALGGADTVTVDDLAGTDVTHVNIDLGVNGAGDARGGHRHRRRHRPPRTSSRRRGRTARCRSRAWRRQVNITQSGGGQRPLTVNGLGGNDTLSGGVGLAALISSRSTAATATTRSTAATAPTRCSAATATTRSTATAATTPRSWATATTRSSGIPGDGSDIVEGQDGTDTLLFNGAAGAEIFAASSNGGRLLFTRNVGNIVMDTDDVEILTLNALGGTDTVTVNDLAADRRHAA